MTRLVFVLAAVAACSNNNNGGPDAKQFKDAPAGGATVQMVSCAGATVTATITTASFAFTPASATITQGQIVEFKPESIHNITPGNVPAGSATSDPGLTCGFGGDCCLMFTHSGTFGFHCAAHTTMNGTITVN